MAKNFAVKTIEGERTLHLVAESPITLTEEGARFRFPDGRVITVMGAEVLPTALAALHCAALLRSAAGKILARAAESDGRVVLAEQRQMLAALKKTVTKIARSKLEDFDSKEERESRARASYREIKAALDGLVKDLKNAVGAQRNGPRLAPVPTAALVDELLASTPLPRTLSWANGGEAARRVRKWLVDLDAEERLMSRVSTNKLARELAAQDCRSTPAAIRDAVTSAGKRKPFPLGASSVGWELLSLLPRDAR
jgi:hypothetical protein